MLTAALSHVLTIQLTIYVFYHFYIILFNLYFNMAIKMALAMKYRQACDSDSGDFHIKTLAVILLCFSEETEGFRPAALH